MSSVVTAKMKTLSMVLGERKAGFFATELVEPMLIRLFSHDISDLRPKLSSLMAVKTPWELSLHKTGGMVAAAYLQRTLVAKVLNYIDKEVGVNHEHFSGLADKDFDEPKDLLKKWAARLNFEVDQVALVYASCQSAAGGYNIKQVGAAGGKGTMAVQGAIILSLGLTYNGFSTMVTRTLLIDPDAAMRAAYV